jgi:DnaK suppressor protein
MANRLTRPQLDELRRKLEAERARILRVLGAEAAAQPAEERQPEIEEAAQRAAEREQSAGVVARERALLAEVDRALARMDRGAYGLSEKSGAPIRYERLAAIPWARQDVDE